MKQSRSIASAAARLKKRGKLTLEHRLLILVDRGVGSLSDVVQILGWEETVDLGEILWCVVDARYVDGVKKGKMHLTETGIERLNELEGE